MSVRNDLRYAVRKLARRPGFTAVAVGTLALGIGANTAIFGVINQMLLRPLPGVADPEELVRVYTSDFSSGPFGSSSLPDYADYRDQVAALQDLAGFAEFFSVTLQGTEGAERLRGAVVTGSFFPVVGARAAVGRLLGPADDEVRGGHAVVVLGHGLWRQRFGGDPAVVGSRLTLQGQEFTVVGVAGEGVTGMDAGANPDVWLPVSMLGPAFGLERFHDSRGSRWLDMVGRLRPGATAEQASAQFRTVSARLADRHPDTNLGTLQDPDSPRPVAVISASDARLGPGDRPTIVKVAWLLMAVVVLVLLIACANLANLLLARARGREREMAVRLSLGSGRARLMRQLLAESLALAVLGAAAGLFLALWLNDLLLGLTPVDVAAGLGVAGMEVDARVLVFTLAVGALAGLLFGLAPAVQATSTDLSSALKESGTRPSRRRGGITLKDGLVVSQVAMALVLMVATGLLLRSVRGVLDTDPGFTLERALLATLDLREVVDASTGPAFLDELEQRLEGLAGVTGATYAMVVPVTPQGARRGVTIDGYQPLPGEDTELNFNVVGHDYFATMGIPVLAGRGFQRGDGPGAAPVAVVNETFARRYFGGRDAVGRTLRWGGDGDPIHVVGMVADGRYRSLREEPTPYIYLPVAQSFVLAPELVVATAGDPHAVVAGVRAVIRELAPSAPLYDVRSMEEHMGTLVAAERTILALVSLFGALALLLAAIGIYGVMSFVVSERRREIGIRMALGSRSSQTLRHFLVRGAALAGGGLALGLVASAAATRLISGFLFGVGALDPLVFAGTAALLAVAALAASALPALRATRVDPMQVLRME